MKGVRFEQNLLNQSLEGINAGQLIFFRKALIALIVLLYFLVGILTSHFITMDSLNYILETKIASTRLSMLLLTLIIVTWFIAGIFLSLQKNILVGFVSYLFAIGVQQVAVELSPSTFPKLSWSAFLINILPSFTIIYLSFLVISFTIALIDVLWVKPTSFIIKNIGIIIATFAAVIGAYLCLSMLSQKYPERAGEILNHRTITTLIGTLFSCLVILCAWLKNRLRNEPWHYPSALRSLVLEIGCWKGTSFYGLDLSGVSLKNAKLACTDLRARKLHRTCLQGVAGLERALVDSRYLDLELPKVQNLLVHAYSDDKNFDRLNLRGAYLQNADLRRMNFIDTELTGADLKNADLRGAILVRTQLMGVDFTGADLTGACIEDWSINSQTLFNNIKCDYVYRKLDDKGEPFDRYPADRNFDKREFESLYQEIGNVVELVYQEGVNWRAFSFALQKLHLEDDGLGLELKGIEKKGDLWVVKVTHNQDVSTKEVEKRFNASYQELTNLLANKEQQINQLLGIATNQAEAIKEFSKRPFGNSFFITGSTITNLAGSGQIEYSEAANQVRNIVANSFDQMQVSTTALNLLTQLQQQNIAITPGTQAELIKQILLTEAEKDSIFKQLLVLQGQKFTDAIPQGAINTAIQEAIAQLS